MTVNHQTMLLAAHKRQTGGSWQLNGILSVLMDVVGHNPDNSNISR